MPVSITLQEIPIGSQFVQTIGSNDPDALNDFRVLILTSENGSGLEESDITLSTGASLVELTGDGVTWEAVIRPPETAGTLTITVGANAFSEGNVETEKDIRISTSFPDADAEVPSLLTSVSSPGAGRLLGITATPTRLLVSSGVNIEFYTHAGSVLTSQRLTGLSDGGTLDYINGDVIFELKRRSLETGDILEEYPFGDSDATRLFHTRLGITDIIDNKLKILPYGKTLSSDFEELGPLPSFSGTHATHQNDLLFTFDRYLDRLFRITEADTLEFVKHLNIEHGASVNSFDNTQDAAIYRDTLYLLESPQAATGGIYTIDIRKYRPMSLNTKTTIYPVFANEGDILDLMQYSPDAEQITFATGFDKPIYLSINSSNELEIASNAVTETQPVLVRFTGINRIDSQDFSFYLIIVQASSPTWRDVEALTMKANTTYNLHQIVDANSIAFESGETQPTGSSMSNGVFTIATTAGTAYFRATKDGLTTDKSIQIDVIQPPDPDNFSDITRYKIEIAGIDVTSDYNRDSPLRLTKSLDDVELSRYRAHSVTVSLRDVEGTYSPDLAGNFWETNNLNPGGYQEEIKVYRESFINDVWVGSLLFVGIIEQQAEQFSAVQVNITAKDISVELERSFISDFGTLSKYDSLRQQSDKATFEGVYVPEGSLLPIQPEVAKAWSNRTALTLRRLQLPTKGPPLSNTGYLTASDFRTSGGFLQTPPLLNTKTLPRSEDVTFLFGQLALTGSVYNTDIRLPEVVLDDPTLFNRGSVPFSVEDTRITRLPVDWVHDLTNDRLLIPLSNPEGHIADLLVQYDIDSDSHRVLHTFAKDVKAHRIERRNATNYYILTSSAITQDRSAGTLPRVVDSTGYAYDSLAEGSDVRIYTYNTNTGVLTAHVEETDTYPPQLGIHSLDRF